MSGVLIIDKDKGLTSRDVVNKVCHIFNTKKVGHTGTLDPLATGVLVVTIGDATKIGEYLVSTEKEYIATCKLGIMTDTLDTEGEITNEDYKIISESVLKEVLNSFIGSYSQEVPIYSAVKINGKKLYEYARNNIDVVLPKREVTVKEIELISSTMQEFTFRCVVSKGTYIRSLIRDICVRLGTIGVMSELRRTKQGNFKVEDALKLSSITKDTKLKSIVDTINFDKISLDNDSNLKKVLNGAKIPNSYNTSKCLFTLNNKALGIYIKSGEMLKPEKMLLEKDTI